MIDFNGNTSKENLRQRINRARQQLKPFKKREAWSAILKPNRLKHPRRSHAGGVTIREMLLSTVILIILLSGLFWLIFYALKSIL